jgi:ABC-type branched-subunit amino acid transport system permease subunit
VGTDTAALEAAAVMAPAAASGIRPAIFNRHQFRTLAVAMALAGIVPLFVHGLYGMGVAKTAGLYVILSLGFYFQFALAGQFSFATVAFYAVGAYTSIWASQYGGFLVGFLAAIVAAGVFGAVVKLLLARSPLIQFAIATLAVTALTLIVLRNWESFTGGGSGRFGVKPVSLFGYDLVTPTEQYYAVAGVAVIGLFLLILFERSPAQRDLVFVRGMGDVARTTGLRATPIVIAAFAIGAAYMGAAGSLLAHTEGFIDITSFDVSIALDVLLMVLLGGTRSLWGPALGAIVLVLLPEWLRSVADYKDLIYAGVILLVVLVLPGGLASIPQRVRALVRRQ